MNDTCTYLVQLSGAVDAEEINAMAPLQLECECALPAATLFSVRTDQSGLIGLLRALHGLGLTLLSIQRREEEREGEHVG